MKLQARDLGVTAYAAAWGIQREMHAAVASGARPPVLLLVEHPPVVTLGRNAGRESLLHPERWYRQRGIELHRTERGGDVTWHGPGQLVGYLIFPVGRRVRELFRRIEQAIIRTAASFGAQVGVDPELAGVWHGPNKLCAVGLAVRDRVSFHGFALNVDPDLSSFDAIVPCGISGRGVTSLAGILGEAPSMALVKERTAAEFEAVFADWEVPCPA